VDTSTLQTQKWPSIRRLPPRFVSDWLQFLQPFRVPALLDHTWTLKCQVILGGFSYLIKLKKLPTLVWWPPFRQESVTELIEQVDADGTSGGFSVSIAESQSSAAKCFASGGLARAKRKTSEFLNACRKPGVTHQPKKTLIFKRLWKHQDWHCHQCSWTWQICCTIPTSQNSWHWCLSPQYLGVAVHGCGPW